MSALAHDKSIGLARYYGRLPRGCNPETQLGSGCTTKLRPKQKWRQGLPLKTQRAGKKASTGAHTHMHRKADALGIVKANNSDHHYSPVLKCVLAKIICKFNSGLLGDCDRSCLIGNFDISLLQPN